MPSVSEPQHNLMEGIAHGWHPSHMKHPPPKNVADDFAAADKASGAFKKKVGQHLAHHHVAENKGY